MEPINSQLHIAHIAHNLLVKAEKESYHNKKLEDIGWQHNGSFDFKCTRCGKFGITGPTLKFFDYDVRKVLCYDCQGMTNQNK